jgi:hypothetical protein
MVLPATQQRIVNSTKAPHHQWVHGQTSYNLFNDKNVYKWKQQIARVLA